MRLTTSQMRDLRRLVTELFTRDEFTDVLLQLGGTKVIDRVTPGRPVDVFVLEALDALQRRGLIDDRFFDLLVEHRPRSARAIRSFQRSVSAPQEAPRYDFFISYSHADADHAQELLRALQNAGARVFMDRLLKPGVDLDRAIREVIEASGTLLVLLSKQSVRSSWIHHEIAIALEESSRRGRMRIVPIFLAPPEELDIPFALRAYIGVLPEAEDGMAGVAARLMGLTEDSRSARRGFLGRIQEFLGIGSEAPWRKTKEQKKKPPRTSSSASSLSSSSRPPAAKRSTGIRTN